MNRIVCRSLAIAAVTAMVSTVSAVAATSANIKVDDQKPNNKTLTIADVDMPRDGFVAIHPTIRGKPQTQQHFGVTAVKAGDHHDVTVKLNLALVPGEKYVAMLHGDSGKTGRYEFGAGHTDVDKPLMKDGKPIAATFTVQK